MDIEYVAGLAHVALSEQEKLKLAPQMSSIVEWVRSLEAMQTHDVVPVTSPAAHKGTMRADEPGAALPRRDALLNAPDATEQFFRVPLIIER